MSRATTGVSCVTECRLPTHQGTDVVLEDGLALEEDGAVGGTGASVEQSASAPADHRFALQDRFFHRVAATKGTDEQRGRTNKEDEQKWSAWVTGVF